MPLQLRARMALSACNSQIPQFCFGFNFVQEDRLNHVVTWNIMVSTWDRKGPLWGFIKYQVTVKRKQWILIHFISGWGKKYIQIENVDLIFSWRLNQWIHRLRNVWTFSPSMVSYLNVKCRHWLIPNCATNTFSIGNVVLKTRNKGRSWFGYHSWTKLT